MSACYMLKPVQEKICVIYIFPNRPNFENYARRFVTTYAANQTQVPHTLYVISNGGKPTPKMLAMFEHVPCEWMIHDNSGWDIGAFQAAARDIPCQLMVFCGATLYIRTPRWLDRITESVTKHGKGIYGAMGNLGNTGVKVFPHIRTTGFWMDPRLLNEYPFVINSIKYRYGFEHGPNNITQWIRNQGMQAWVTYQHRELPWPHWNNDPQGFHRGKQTELIFADRVSDLHAHV